MLLTTDTIAAIATPPGEGAIGVVRLSGRDAAAVADRIFRRVGSRCAVPLAEQPSHRLFYGTIVDPATGAIVDEVLLAWMRGPHTYTRDDTVEISCHGGPIPLQETLRLVLAHGARPAERGEFTLRAFLNGRLDLTQAEAVLNVIGARTAESLRRAVEDLGGSLAARLAPASSALVRLLAYLDASADFPDDEIETSDVPDGLRAAIDALEDVLAGTRAGQLYRNGARLALIGRPNVGKSSLMNAILRTDRSIVTPIAGTTRDIITEPVSIDGIPVTLMDTAGIVTTDDPVERIGVERSRTALATADLIVWVIDGAATPQPADLAIAAELSQRRPDEQTPVVLAINKADLPTLDQSRLTSALPGAPVVHLSAQTAAGLPELETAVTTALTGTRLVEPALVTVRQRAALQRAMDHLHDAQAAQEQDLPQDLLATSVRAALHAVGEVTGERVDDAVLTEIFSSFCIGK